MWRDHGRAPAIGLAPAEHSHRITLARTASATFGSTIDPRIPYNKNAARSKEPRVAGQLVVARMPSLGLHLLSLRNGSPPCRPILQR